MVLLGGVALGAQPPIVVKLSCGRSVGRSVCRSVRCIVENGGSDPDTVWYHRSDWSRNEAGSGVWRSVLLGAHLGRAIVTNGDFTRGCATMPQPSELRFGVVRAVGRGTAVLDDGPRRARRKGGFGAVSYTHLTLPTKRIV